MTNQPAASTYDEERAARERIANTVGGYYIPTLQVNPQAIRDLIDRNYSLMDSSDRSDELLSNAEQTIAELRAEIKRLSGALPAKQVCPIEQQCEHGANTLIAQQGTIALLVAALESVSWRAGDGRKHCVCTPHPIKGTHSERCDTVDDALYRARGGV